MDNLYDDSVLIGQDERKQFLAQQTQQALPQGGEQAFDEQTNQYLESLDPAERQAAIDRINAPMTGEDVAEALKQDVDYVPTEPEYLQYVAYNKTHETSILDGIGEGASMVLNDLGKAVSAVADHPLKALASAPPSLIEAFAQGTRNLYGMVAQSANPDSVLFKFKNALAGDGSSESYNQFLEARKFNKHSARLASGEDTIVMDKNVIDHDITLAMSYIADPTLFVPFGAAASAGMRAVGMGEKLVALGGRAAQLRSAVIGGGLKWGVGAPIEFIGSTTRNVIDSAVATGGNVLETATGISAAELRTTARLSAVGTTTASALGGHLPVVSNISNAYVGAGAAAGIGEAIGAVGEQMLKQGGKRGFNSFAREAFLQTPNLSNHAKGLLKVLDAVDPMLSYGYGMAEGAAQGAVIGGTLGYLSGGKEGLGQGIGAGIALGGVGAGAGRLFADISGGTMMARAEVQGGFVLENMRATNHQNFKATDAYVQLATLNGDRAGALQVVAGLDRIAPDMRLVVGNYADQVALLKSRGLDIDGHKIDPATGKKILDANGKPVEFAAGADAFKGGEGFVMYTDMDATGKRQVTVHINTEARSNNVMHHELFHAVFAETVMKGMFRDKFAKAILGEYDANGIRVRGSEIDPKEFRAFVSREFSYTIDPTTNARLSKAEHAKRMAEFDANFAEYKKAGSTTKMNPDSAKALDKIVEEFGAHYATQFMKGKPLDYLFHGGELTGIRGMMDRVQNSFLDFWQANITKQNPTYGDFSKSFDESFAPNKGKRTLEQRSSAIDYAVQDLIRAAAGKRKGSTSSVDVRTMTPESRKAFFESSGMDGTKYFFDKDGKPRAVTEAQVKLERLAVGKAVHDSLSKLDPKVVAGLVDVDGSFVASSTLGTKFNDTMLTHLVKEGHISQVLADRIRAIQEIVSGNGSNVVSYLYHGESMETEVGPRSPRLYGADVPITARNTIVVGYKISVKKDGTMSLVMKGLDKNIIDARGNTLWADKAVRDLWQGDRNAFDQSFFDYLSNASKASTDNTRVESSLLPSLARGDGLGAERRNVMHQFLGMAKRESATYFNKPIAEIPRGKTSTVFNQSIDLMSPMRSDLPTRYDFNLETAHSDLSRNFKVSDMEVERTPSGDIFKHASGYKIISEASGAAKLYDANGEMIGSFKDKDAASVQMEKAYAAERVETEKRIERVKESQQKQQNNFKVWDDNTLAEGRRLGDIFATDEGKAFVHGTNLIRQTREEFYSDNFLKLRQADPESVMTATEQLMAKVSKIQELKTQLEDAFYGSTEKGVKREIKRQELMNVAAHLQRYTDIRLAYLRATKGGQRNGQVILDYINTHRKTSVGYDNMAKIFFGDVYDSQFQTGKPVTTVATHGTNSNELLTSREFDTAKLGSRHMSDKDKVGVFLSGETKTSFGYSDPNQGEVGYRQVRAAVKFNNPFVVDYGFQCFDGAKYDRIFTKARAGGHDGVIIKNVYDGGNADTVFIVMADKVKDNTAIIDTHIGMDKIDTAKRTLLEDDQGSQRYPIQQSMPRGKDVRVGSELGLAWKVDDTNAPKESPQDYSRLKLVRETLPMIAPALWEQLKKSGRVMKNFDPREILGEVFVINPDAMILGNVKMGDSVLIEGALGGPNFVMGEGARSGNEIWANTKGAANTYEKQLADIVDRKINDLNKEARRQKWSKERLDAEIANITTHIVITKGTNQKPLSNPTAFKGASDIIKTFVQEGMITDADVKAMFQKTSEQTVPVPEDKKTGKFPVDENGVRLRERVHADVIDFKDIMELPMGEFLAEVGRRAEKSFLTRGDLMKETLNKLAQLPSMKKDAKSLAKMRAMFDDPKFKLNKAENLGEAIALKFSEPFTDGLKTSEAYASISFKGKAKVVKGSHPDYPYSIVPAGMSEPTFHLWSDAISIEKLVDKTIIPSEAPSGSPAKYSDLSKLKPSKAGNKLGSNSVGWVKAKMKPVKSLPQRPAGEGRIGINYKVSDEARAYDEAIKRDDLSTAADIARKMAEKKFGMPIIYDPSPQNKRQNVTEKIAHTKSRLADGRDSVLEYGREEGDAFVFDKEKLRKELESEQKRWKETYKTPEDEPMPLESRKAGWKQSFRSDMPRTISERLVGLERDFNDRVRLYNQVKEKLVGLEQDASSGGELFTTGKAVAVQAWHGSPFGKRTSFSKDMLGSFTKADSATKGHFFAGDISTASVYQSKEGFTIHGVPIKTKGWALLDANTHNEVLMHLEDEYAGLSSSVRKRKSMESWIKDYISTPAFADLVNDLAPSGYTYDKTPIKPVMYATYLKMNNPFVFDFQGREYREQSYSSVIEQAKKAGHDSVILTNTYDGAKLDNIFVMLSGNENNIKDANFITKSDSGKRISLDKRFNTTVDDIRYKASDADAKPDLKPFEGNYKVSDSVKKGVRNLGKFVDENADTANLSPDIKNAINALREAVRKQDATDEVLVPEVREAYDKIVAAVDSGIQTPALTPVAVLKELKKTIKPLDKEIAQNTKDTAKRIADKDMAEGADIESAGIEEGQADVRRDMEEGASLESDQITSELDRKRGENRLDMEEGASLESDEATGRVSEVIQDLNDGADIEAAEPRNQNLPPQFPYPAPPAPAGLPSYKPSGKPAFPKPPATPPLPSVKPSGAVPFPRPPATPALPRGSTVEPPPIREANPSRPFPDNVPASKPLGKLEGWRGWTLEKGLNGGFWKNAVGWMIVVQGDKFKVYNPQKAMQGIYEDLDAAKRRVQRAEPKQ